MINDAAIIKRTLTVYHLVKITTCDDVHHGICNVQREREGECASYLLMTDDCLSVSLVTPVVTLSCNCHLFTNHQVQCSHDEDVSNRQMIEATHLPLCIAFTNF